MHTTTQTEADAKLAAAAHTATLNIVATRKVNAKDYGVSGRWATVQVLPPGGRGRNARGTSASKRGWGGSVPKGAKRAKRQGADRMGRTPHLSSSRLGTWV